jgi:ribosome-binding factor A
MNNTNIRDFIEGFNLAKKRIRKKIAERIKLKFVPEISFHYDDSIKDIEKIEKIFASKKVFKDINK